MPNVRAVCKWTTLGEALAEFASAPATQSAAHIKPLHWYVACRLAIEGGFDPDEITPRPPLVVRTSRGKHLLECVPAAGQRGERTVLGALRTKKVDVVVTKDGIGPVVAVSTKGATSAFRNLTNRMEEAVGDCTNLHIAYPALVYGFLQVIRANREQEGTDPNDVAIRADGQVSEPIRRYHDVLVRLAGRLDIRDDASKYEAVAVALVSPDASSVGEIVAAFPPPESPLALEHFFDTLYRQYDQRYVYAAPQLEAATRRLTWHPESPVAADPRIGEYQPRISG